MPHSDTYDGCQLCGLAPPKVKMQSNVACNDCLKCHAKYFSFWTWTESCVNVLTDGKIADAAYNGIHSVKGETINAINTDEAADVYEEEQWFERSTLSFLCRTQSSFEAKFGVKPHEVSEKPKSVTDTKSADTHRYLVCNPLQEDLVLDIVREKKITKQVHKFMTDDNMWNGHGDSLLAHSRTKAAASLPDGMSIVNTDNEIWDKVNKLRKEQWLNPLPRTDSASLHQSNGRTCDDGTFTPTKQVGCYNRSPRYPGDFPPPQSLFSRAGSGNMTLASGMSGRSGGVLSDASDESVDAK